MKKKLCLLVVIILMSTGCTCEYNLTIDNNTYKESVNIVGTNNSERNNLNTKIEIPVDKNNYYYGDQSTNYSSLGDIYNYSYNNGKLNMSHDFIKSEFINSTLASACYKTLTVTNYQGNTVISTSNGAMCFDNYSEMTNLVINITVDKNVISNNADKVNGNTYTWNLTKDNSSNKAINLVFQNEEGNEKEIVEDTKNNNKDYTMFIMAGILLIVMLIVYAYVNNLKNDNDGVDD